MHTWHKTPPPENEVIIVSKSGSKEQAQVTIRDGVAYAWCYKDTDEKFCDVSEISAWRGCGGFDF